MSAGHLIAARAPVHCASSAAAAVAAAAAAGPAGDVITVTSLTRSLHVRRHGPRRRRHVDAAVAA